ncbi:2',3'-cyclic-nucleotide 2'-phosphodiesterase/5'-or 3'-nucleotidase, 5'-nucleotidase family [Paracoccus halophilus]|uniref:2',3'-cyclic-nucleotide 2'-phosphodiesterase/5'-or 3'-nucleotidase, 5'-nucleotidase family n=1 Tax=Paracoccus halophilus TaxID=376733 RepID=A0A1I0SMQ0_9RHOB|nr:5'-nucleotidase C-terminal domain-containing protein [Paracoccus halophilus]SFA40790.1 2',3'-cyclic-nucleotide 2'-phosphodiesterase/5'-or 3'-nucleotidase, 5'-nucleotidase family [Paracoccus halophilus]
MFAKFGAFGGDWTGRGNFGKGDGRRSDDGHGRDRWDGRDKDDGRDKWGGRDDDHGRDKGRGGRDDHGRDKDDGRDKWGGRDDDHGRDNGHGGHDGHGRDKWGHGGKDGCDRPEPTNENPVAADDYVLADGKKVTVDVLANDSDADGNRLEVTEINGIKVDKNCKVILRDDDGDVQGWAKVNEDGEIVVKKYDDAGEIQLTYTVSDGKGGEDEATLTVADQDTTFRLNLLHFSDQEANASSTEDAPNLSAVLNALRDQDLGADGVLTVTSGDALIPGLFFDASTAVYGAPGIADILIQNELGIDAIALGNHDFDLGTEVLADLISGAAAEGFGGTAFPYLSTNLDFSTDPNLAPLAVEGGQAPQGNSVTSSVIIETGGEQVAVIGATTPTLSRISSSGEVTVMPVWADTIPTAEEIAALAEIIQAEVDALLAANPDLNKVVLATHMQQLSIEEALAPLLENVDVIVAGGSNTRLVDENDRLRDGDSAQGTYPIFVENAGGTTTAIVNTDGNYSYVGRLVVDFDEDGNIIPASYDADVSGVFATDDQGVVDLGAEDLVDPEIQEIADNILAEIVETQGNVFGISNVYLNGNRSGTDAADDPDGVRVQETNLGNLTADANLAYANEIQDDVEVWMSIKNGGGIRASIGEITVPAGETEAVRGVNSAIYDAEGNEIRPEGGISQNDIQTALAFNNDLAVGTLTAAEIVELLEYGISALPDVNGRFPQISGIQFSFDPTAAAGDRIEDAVFVDPETGAVRAVLVDDGEVVDATREYGVVTLDFLSTGGDGYPFPTGDEFDFVSIENLGVQSGDATFADDGTEQDALAEYLLDNHATADTAYDEADTGRDMDVRIVNLGYQDGAALDAAVDEFLLG